MWRSLTVLVLLLLMGLSCGTISDTETGTTAVGGLVVDPVGKPVAKARAILHQAVGPGALAKRTASATGNTDTVCTADEDGHFFFNSPKPGDYFIEIYDPGAANGVVVEASVVERETTHVSGVVRPVGRIVGKVELDAFSPGDSVRVVIEELRRAVSVNNLGVFDVPTLPPWSYTLKVFRADSGVESPIQFQGVAVREGQVTELEHKPRADDYVLLAHRLTKEESSQFSDHDRRISAFWANWGGRDSVLLTPARNTYPGRGSFAGGSDALMTIKAAGDQKGVYLLATVEDDRFMPVLSRGGDSSWANDAVDIYLDSRASREIMAAAETCFVRPQFGWSITHTSRQLQVWMGCVSMPTFLRYSYFDGAYETWKAGLMKLDDVKTINNGMAIEIVAEGVAKKSQEWFIPWSLLGVRSPVAGKRLAMSGGYNDFDGAGQLGVKSLRWRLRDPFSSKENNRMLNMWGDLELGLGFAH